MDCIQKNIQRITFKEQHSSLLYLSSARNKFVVFIQNREKFQNFKGAKDFIKQRIKKICGQRKLSVEEVFSFYIFLGFQCYTVMAGC